MLISEKITEIARELRKNMTNSEKLLWQKLRARKLGVKFLRQHPIHVLTEDTWQARCIIADFYCHEHKLIIELDGSIHDISEVLELDIEKEKLLINQWFQVLRFKNTDIQWDIENVLLEIQKKYTV